MLSDFKHLEFPYSISEEKKSEFIQLFKIYEVDSGSSPPSLYNSMSQALLDEVIYVLEKYGINNLSAYIVLVIKRSVEPKWEPIYAYKVLAARLLKQKNGDH